MGSIFFSSMQRFSFFSVRSRKTDLGKFYGLENCGGVVTVLDRSLPIKLRNTQKRDYTNRYAALISLLVGSAIHRAAQPGGVLRQGDATGLSCDTLVSDEFPRLLLVGEQNDQRRSCKICSWYSKTAIAVFVKMVCTAQYRVPIFGCQQVCAGKMHDELDAVYRVRSASSPPG